MSTRISTKTSTTGGAGLASGVGLAPLIIWILGQAGVDMPPEVAAIAGGLIAAAVTTVIAWLMPAKQGKHVDTEPWVLEPVGELVDDENGWDREAFGSMADHATKQTPELEEDRA